VIAVTAISNASCSVIEFGGNKPDLERAFDRCLRSREEDANTFT
jgi:hypothetical protein